jgi:hypothetical protein
MEQWIALVNREYDPSDDRGGYRRRAEQQFWQAYARGKRRKWFTGPTSSKFQLQDLAEALKGLRVKARHDLGRQSVPVHRIRGSEGRSHEFDDEFNPRTLHTMGRWIDIAFAQQLGLELPPINLIKFGEVYFVRDGHHRVSVASFKGQAEIDAEVTVWEL